jgi:hypothetical protein
MTYLAEWLGFTVSSGIVEGGRVASTGRFAVVPESLHATSASWDQLSATLHPQQLPPAGLSGTWASASAVGAVHAATGVAGQVMGARVTDRAATIREAALAYVRQEARAAGQLDGVSM